MTKPKIVVDREKALVIRNGKRVEFGPKEYACLVAFAMSGGKVVTRRYLLTTAFQYEPEDIESRTVDQHISRIRAKIGQNAILTVTGQGYRSDAISLAAPIVGKVIGFDNVAGHALVKFPVGVTAKKGQEVALNG